MEKKISEAQMRILRAYAGKEGMPSDLRSIHKPLTRLVRAGLIAETITVDPTDKFTRSVSYAITEAGRSAVCAA